MQRNLPPQPTPHGPSVGHLKSSSLVDATPSGDAEERARRVEAEALGTGLDDAGQPPNAVLAPKAAPKDMPVKDMRAKDIASSKTHPSVVEVKQARILRRQIQVRDHGNGPQYNPHRDDRRPAAHQADSGNDWHQAS